MGTSVTLRRLVGLRRHCGRGRRVRIIAEGEHIVERLLGLGRGVNDRGLVSAENAKPMRHIAGMAVMQLIRQTEVRADQPAPDLGDEFLKTIGLVTEALPKGARQSLRSSRPMRGLVRAHRGIMVHRAKRAPVRHLDVIERRREIGLIAAMPDFRRYRGEKAINLGLADRRIDRRGILDRRIVMRRQAVDLVCIEHHVMAKEADAPFLLGAGDRVRFRLLEAGIIDRQRAELATAHIAAQRLGLAVCHPITRAIALGIANCPEVEGIDARVRRSAMSERPPAASL